MTQLQPPPAFGRKIFIASLFPLAFARSNGVNLTEIVRTANPKFDFLNTPKTAYRHALDVLVNQGRIRFTMKGKRRDLYFLDCEYRETSKRVIFKKFVEDILATL